MHSATTLQIRPMCFFLSSPHSHRIRSALLAAIVMLTPGILMADDDHHAGEESDVELIEVMVSLQYFTHKLALSLDAKNGELVDFYIHELEESIEAMEAVPVYGGFPIADLAKSMIAPQVEALETAAKQGDLQLANQRFAKVLQSCNSCHEITDHGFIKIERSDNNPFFQNFSP